jgi:predicted  nucleic acid-binding Zn-ribbon protein
VAFEPSDIAIFLISAAACIYCIVLSRRLKALQNTKDGLGATIVAFSESMSALSASTNETRAQVLQLANRLPPLITEAQQACEALQVAMDTLEARNDAITDKLGTSHDELEAMMRKMLDASVERIVEMRTLLMELQNISATIPAVSAPDIDTGTIPNRKQAGLEHDLF